MPAGKWAWQCNVIRESADVATIEAARDRPPIYGLRPLRDKAIELGYKKLRWERVDDDGETRVFVHDLDTGVITDETKPPVNQTPRIIALILIGLTLAFAPYLLK